MTIYIFQLIPIILAVIAIYSCSRNLANSRRHHDRIAMAMAIIASVLMLCTQFLWDWVFPSGTEPGPMALNMMWTLFKSTTMLCFIYMSTLRRRYESSL